MIARAVAVIALSVGVARAGTPSLVATTPQPPATPQGLAIGAELGDPTSITAAWFAGKLDVDAALGTATLESVGWSLHVDAQAVIAEPAPDVSLRVGLGMRYYRHSHLMSIDELPSSQLGVRASLAVALRRGPIELYAEVAPGIDVARGASCSLVDGVDSVCPHSQESPWFFQMVIGARWFVSQ
jgi:hypothetical protein